MKAQKLVLFLCAFAPLTGVSAAQLQPEFLHLRIRSTDRTFISSDGQTVVGMRAGTPRSLFRWTARDGFKVLDPGATEPRMFAPVAISGDGNLAIGLSFAGVAAIWDEQGRATALGSLYGNATSPIGISRDGSVVIGSSLAPSGHPRAFRWTHSGGMTNLGTLGAPGASTPHAVTPDGSVIVGQAVESGQPRAFRWTAASGMVALPVPVPSTAFDVSDDGLTILGTFKPANGQSSTRQVFLWSAATGVTVFGGPGFGEPIPLVLSDDGSAAAFGFGIQGAAQYWTSASGSVQSFDDWSVQSMSANGEALLLRGRTPGSELYAHWTAARGFTMLASSLNVRPRPRGLSSDGTRFAGSVLTGYSPSRPNAVLWRLDDEVGARFCGPAIPNSTGASGELRALGTNEILASDLVFNASSLPVSTFGFLLAAPSEDDVFPVSGSQGRLCLGGGIGRFSRPDQIQLTGSSGTFEFALPMDAIATPTGRRPALPGETWNFQAWYRDANPNLTSNFTNGVRVTLQ